MTVLPQPLLNHYLSRPLELDQEVRRFAGIPDDRYFTVSVFPVPGQVRVSHLRREIKLKKISKSET